MDREAVGKMGKQTIHKTEKRKGGMEGIYYSVKISNGA